MQKEWDSLRELGAWDEKAVQEWSAVRDAAKKAGKRINVGMVFGICVEKGSELPEGTRAENTKEELSLEVTTSETNRITWQPFEIWDLPLPA